MFLEKIHTFLPLYRNLGREDFILMLNKLKKNSWLFYKYEKDFLLTLILIKFGEKYPDLVFKWGTCLNKIYFPYFRLSEDLDFMLNISMGRAARKSALSQYETDFQSDLQLLWLRLRDERTKFDEHKLAMFTFEYESILDNSIQTIKIDISLKSTLVLPPNQKQIRSIYKDSVLEENVFIQEHTISCIDLTEALAEKMRASLTRTEPAIRDFFDIWYAKEKQNFNFHTPEFHNLLEKKLQEVDYEYTLESDFDLLKKQIETDLKPVLTEEFDFNFAEIFSFVVSFKK